MQDYKDESGLQFINFDFVTGDQEIKLSILMDFLIFFLSLFSLFSSHFFAFVPFGDFFYPILR